MELKTLQKTRRSFRRRSLLFFVLLAFGSMLGLAVAQSVGGGFSLNSPASFPVDI